MYTARDASCLVLFKGQNKFNVSFKCNYSKSKQQAIAGFFIILIMPKHINDVGIRFQAKCYSRHPEYILSDKNENLNSKLAFPCENAHTPDSVMPQVCLRQRLQPCFPSLPRPTHQKPDAPPALVGRAPPKQEGGRQTLLVLHLKFWETSLATKRCFS